MNEIGQPRLVGHVLEHCLRAGRAADIAHTYEKYLGHHGLKCEGKPDIFQAFFNYHERIRDKLVSGFALSGKNPTKRAILQSTQHNMRSTDAKSMAIGFRIFERLMESDDHISHGSTPLNHGLRLCTKITKTFVDRNQPTSRFAHLLNVSTYALCRSLNPATQTLFPGAADLL